jgi:hypothetical protein
MAVLWTPVPEPESIIVLLAGLPVAALFLKNKRR